MYVHTCSNFLSGANTNGASLHESAVLSTCSGVYCVHPVCPTMPLNRIVVAELDDGWIDYYELTKAIVN